MTCVDCHKPIQSDGYGEFVHRETNRYACHNKNMPDNRNRIPRQHS